MGRDGNIVVLHTAGTQILNLRLMAAVTLIGTINRHHQDGCPLGRTNGGALMKLRRGLGRKLELDAFINLGRAWSVDTRMENLTSVTC